MAAVPPQQLIVTSSPPEDVAAFWERMTEAAPEVFNAWFVMSPGRGQDD